MGQQQVLLSPVPAATPLASSKKGRLASYLQRKDVTYLLLFLLGCLPYLNTFRNNLVYDDVDQVLGNPFIQTTHHIWQIFTTSVWTFKIAKPDVAYFRPMMSLTFLGLHEIYGEVAAGYHIFNVVLAGWIVCLVFAVLFRWTQNRPLALIAGVIFALHPAHSEVVAWVSDVTDLEVAFFILLAFWSYLALDQSRGYPWLRQLETAAFFALALLSKEIAVALPPLAMVFEHFYREDRSRTSFLTKAGRYLPLWFVFGLYFIYRWAVLGEITGKPMRHYLGFKETIYCGAQLFSHYLYKLFWPQHLQAFYVFTPSLHLAELPVIAGLFSFLLLLVLGLVFLRSQPVISFGVVWYFAFIGLALNVHWLAAAAFAERYLFLPSVSFAWIAAVCILGVWRACAHRPRFLRPVLAAAAAIVAILAFARIYTRNRDWHDNETLFVRTLQQDPSAVHIRVNLGAYYWGVQKQPLAIREWQIAHQQQPTFFPPIVNLGMAAIFNNDWPTAEKYLERAAELSPTASSPHYWLGILREKQGRLDEAKQQLLQAEALAPYDFAPYAELGHLYSQEGHLAEAAKQLKFSAAQMNDPISWDDLGDLYFRLGQLDNAESAYRSALASNQFDSQSHIGLGQIYEKRGDATKAVEEYKSGLKLQPNNPIALAGIARLQKSKSN
jgi:protein O-mannosyl-transferase